MGLKWNPFTSNLDFAQSGDVGLSAKILVDTLTAIESISALRLIYLHSETEGGLGNYLDNQKKDVIGISLTAATVGNNFDVLLFGKHSDSFFNFSVNENIFLGENGLITNTPPITGYSVLVGKGLGNGSVFIDIERPIFL